MENRGVMGTLEYTNVSHDLNLRGFHIRSVERTGFRLFAEVNFEILSVFVAISTRPQILHSAKVLSLSVVEHRDFYVIQIHLRDE